MEEGEEVVIEDTWLMRIFKNNHSEEGLEEVKKEVEKPYNIQTSFMKLQKEVRVMKKNVVKIAKL